jgi:hypothetical protein
MTLWDTSIWWVLLAAVSFWVIGAVWYSPAMFTKPWKKELGIKDGASMDGIGKLMVASFLLTLILVMVETYFVHIFKSPTALNGAYLGGKLWLGFVGTTSAINYLYEKKSLTLWLIDQGYFAVGMIVAGAILVH